jgi:cyclopropane fatty-acyl-phospholipid synthase-like methyltransferase
MRNQIHNHCMRHFKPGNHILELNCGTGIDAIFFAEQGMNVHATDISDGMLNELREKISSKNLGEKITTQQCSFTELEKIGIRKSAGTHIPASLFDCIFSDFGGLNCVKEIDKVFAQFKNLLKPGGIVTLVIMPSVCPWELLLAFKGNFKTAFRRLKKNGAPSHLEGETFMSYYFTPSQIIKAFGSEYQKIELQGLASFVPPPYLENFPKKYPSFFSRLTKLDEKFCHTFPFDRWADHYILTMVRQDSNSDEDLSVV